MKKLYIFSKICRKSHSVKSFSLSHMRYGSSLGSPQRRKFRVIDGNLNICDNEYEKLMGEANIYIDKYNEKLTKIIHGGSSSAITRHTVKNKKVLARERMRLLFDTDYPILELCSFAGLDMEYGDILSAGIISAIGRISGQLCVLIANDATVKGGTIFPIGVKKQLRMQEVAAQNNLPCVYSMDSGGAFLPLQSEIFPDIDDGGRSFYNVAIMNAEGIPQVSIVAGSCTAGAAYIPTMSNEVVMVDKIGSIFLAGPPLVYAAIGQRISEQDLGGADVHCSISGCADYKANDEMESIELAKDIMTTLNMDVYLQPRQHVEDPLYSCRDLPLLSLKRDEEGRLDILKILSRLVDGSRFHEFKPSFGGEIITGFAHLDGILIGVVANHGKFTPDSCLKGGNFVSLCNQRGIPILFLQDIIGDCNDVNLIKYLSQLMSAVAVSTVPKISVILGKSYSIGNYAMCGRSMEPRFLFLWPTAKLFIENIADIDANEYRDGGNIEKESSCYYSSSRLWDDGIILPQETRNVLALSLNACMSHKPVEKSSLTNVLRM